MKDLEKPFMARIDKRVKHQNIGGKRIRIEKETTMQYFYDLNFDNMTYAESNFINRRLDLISNNFDEETEKFDNEDLKVYYGHVDNLGYFVAADEIKVVK